MNFFTDNSDLTFIFKTGGLDEIIAMYEPGFADAERFDYAPRSAEDARDSCRRICELAGSIAADIIAPLGERIDREQNTIQKGRVLYSEPVQQCVRALRQAELMGCTISRDYGGLNLPQFVFTMLVEIISRADASIQNIFGLQGISGIIENFADETIKEKYLPLFAAGSVTGAMALTEDEAGSDLQNVKTSARQEADGSWRINGVKRFITNGGAEVLLVLARSEPGTTDGLGLSLFLCEGDETVRVRRLEDKLGIHGSPTCEMTFSDTPAYLIGERQRGLVTYVLALLNGARLATAAQAIGIAQAAYTEARDYARVRKQYGRRIETLGPVADMLVSMKTAIEAARALTYETARIMDLSVGTDARLKKQALEPAEKKQLRKDAKRYERLTMLLTSLTKYYASEMSVRVTHDAMQVLGGSGYMRDYPVEKYYRDARITSIYEGTSQMQVLSAYRGIVAGTLEKYVEECAAGLTLRQQAAPAKKLAKARALLRDCAGRLSESRDSRVVELYSRTIVDMAVDILLGYLLLKQSSHCTRKLCIARRFVNALEPRLGMHARLIKKGDTAAVTHFDQIVNED